MMERPILFSTPMVRAILEGRKSQTRRIIKKQPESVDHINHKMIPYNGSIEFLQKNLKCPYGQPGDVLWVRETWAENPFYGLYSSDGFMYKATQSYIPDDLKWKSPRFMPKTASRIKLLVKDVRVERVQDITEEDAIAEGIEYMDNQFVEDYDEPLRIYCDYSDKESILLVAKSSYKSLWESINGKGSWEKNPWAWVITFEIL